MDTSTASPLCDQCWHLLEVIEAEGNKCDFKVRWHRSLYTECALCAALPLGVSSSIPYTVIGYEHPEEQLIDLRFFPREPVRGLHIVSFAVCRVQDDETLFSLSRKAALEDNIGHDSVLKVASEWTSRCTSRHDRCVKNERPQYYPTRLLQIDVDKIFLIEDETQISGPYATLSYSWGNISFKVLTEQTLREFRSGIRIQELPSTFRDAVSVVSKLGISYLWIDCYCILQDEGSHNDKQHEMAKMEEVYSNAILNIGAAWASSPMGGLFARRRTRASIHITWDSKSTGGNRSYLVCSRDQLKENYFDFSRPESSTIFRRAWCLQERFLCPRMLHFCKSGLYWECDTIEVASDSVPTLFPWRALRLKRTSFSIRERRAQDYFTSYQGWENVVTAYSEMELSHPAEDKMVACGGVAKQMAKLMSDEYVAGFFRRDLIQKLTWTSHYTRTSPVRARSRRAEQWRAPSWSWASINGKIWPSRSTIDETEALAQIMALHCKLLDPANPYGALVSAMIILKGWVADVDFVGSNECGIGSVRWGPTEIMVTFDDVDEPRKDLIILLTTRRVNSSGFSTQRRDGLLLAPVDKNQLGKTKVYKRVGAFNNELVIDESKGLKILGRITRRFVKTVVSII